MECVGLDEFIPQTPLTKLFCFQISKNLGLVGFEKQPIKKNWPFCLIYLLFESIGESLHLQEKGEFGRVSPDHVLKKTFNCSLNTIGN